MQLRSFEFSEMHSTPREWRVSRFGLEHVNLFVGRNASGKTRILNCVSALAGLIRAKPDTLFASGEWACEFEHEGKSYLYELKLKERQVAHEALTLDNKPLLRRGQDGSAKMWFDRLQQNVDIKMPLDAIAVFQRRDEEQHPFLEPLAEWALNLRFYPFSTDFGRQLIWAAPAKEGDENPSDPATTTAISDPQRVVELYCRGYERFGDDFDAAIVKDFKSVGYEISVIEAVHARTFTENVPLMPDKIPVGLQVQEVDLPGATRQFDMSMGMYRALALVIHINYSIFANEHSTVLVDDIGEGLDFDRSKSLIKLLIKKCAKRMQIVMTTNDRFVMNEVDLKHWHVVDRSANVVQVLDYKNSKEVFDRFKGIGLSNFDFFSRKAYLG